MKKKELKRDLGTELCFAVAGADPDKVEGLLAEGADVNSYGDRRRTLVANKTPLWLAVNMVTMISSEAWNDLTSALSEAFPDRAKLDNADKRKRLLRIIEMLFRAKADPEMLSFGTTALAQAVIADDLKMVSLLLAMGASPNAESLSILSSLAKEQRIKGPLGSMGYYGTVLHSAVRKNSISVTKALLDAGADPTRADHEGKTPMDIAREKGSPEIIMLLEQAMPKK